MKEECHDNNGMIMKEFSECEKCECFPCAELIRALNAIVEGEN